MTRLDGASLDRWITGNYGEDQFAEPDAGTDECQMNDCHQVTEDGVLCAAHQEPERKDQP